MKKPVHSGGNDRPDQLAPKLELGGQRPVKDLRPAELALFGMLLILIALAMTSCAHLRAPTSRGVNCSPPEVLAVAPLSAYLHKTTGVASFTAPAHATGAVEWLNRVYLEKLFQEGPFTRIKPLDFGAASTEDAIRLGRGEECDLVLVPELVSLLESSGAMPTELQVRVSLLEVDTGRLLVGLRQRATSEPGADIDLVWNILEGQPALRFRQLAEMLAVQHARFLASSAGAASAPWGK
ncbi:MAG: hypothetical protein MUC41_06185 [Syntrophobacteraceae bacterium]|jgi:hypothetical protein|nr:hypothetical protein [Syntrophobacteraceae bacterium]